MSDTERNKLYKESQCTITNLIRNNQDIDKKIVTNLLVLIKGDVTSTSKIATKKFALEMLEFLCRQKNDVIQAELFELLGNTEQEKVLHQVILETMKKNFMIHLIEDMNIVNILKPWMQHQAKLTAVLGELFHALSREDIKALLMNKVIPTMMSPNLQPDKRNIVIDIAFILSPIVTVFNLTSEELESFLQKVFKEYIPCISSLRLADYPNWDKMWIFLVRFCDKHIHNSMDLTNKLLRVVEFAFRSTSYVQRLKGYDCWKELIANASLDMNYMSGPKHIKLLVTPLKAKFSKQEVVICKRFEVFCYLLEKLESKAVLCLPEFLDFCFGPIRDCTAMRCGQGKSVPQLWPKSAKVLIEIIGHGHKAHNGCVSGRDSIKLEKPVITGANFDAYYEIVISAVGECCMLLKDADLGTIENEKVVTCMWTRLIHLACQYREGNVGNYFQLILEVLDNYLKESTENPYFQDLLVIVIKVLSSTDEANVWSAFKYFSKPLHMVLFNADSITTDTVNSLKPLYSQIFFKMTRADEKVELTKELMGHMIKARGSEKNGQLFLLLSDEFLHDADVEKLEDFDEFFMWPVRNSHLIDEDLRREIFLHWIRLYNKLITASEQRKFTVLKDLEKIFKNNPLLASSVTSILNLISQCESKFSHEFVISFMNVLLLILELPNLQTDSHPKLSGIIMQYCDHKLSCFRSPESEVVVKKICMCLERIIGVHGYFKILDTFSHFIQDCWPLVRSQFAKYLSHPLETIYQDEYNVNSPAAKTIHKILQLLTVAEPIQEQKKVFVPPNGRAARIASLAKSSPQSPPSKVKATNQATLVRLFGKDLESMSPLKVKGSLLNNSTPKRSKKLSTVVPVKPAAPSINDESSSQFVVIDTEINFQPEKLNEHQKEVLKKRREDIPALYQDLSQSQSQDMFSTKGNSRDNKENLNEENVDIMDQPVVEDKEVIESTEDHKELESVEGAINVVNNSEEFIKVEAPSSISNEPLSEDIFVQSDIKSADLFSEVVVVKGEAITDYPSIEIAKEEPQDVEDVKIETIDDALQDGDKMDEVLLETANNKHDKLNKKTGRKRGTKRSLELSRIHMDIVGADDFLSTSSRRSRNKEPPKPEVRKRVRKPKSLDKSETAVSKNRRKTVGDVSEVPSALEASARSDAHTAYKDTKKRQPRKNKNETSPNQPANRETSRTRMNPPETASATEAKTKPVRKSSNDADNETPKLSRRRSFISQLKDSARARRRATQPNIKDWTALKVEKRKASTDEETEDVIESSQGSDGNLTPLLNSSKKRRLIGNDDLEVSEDSTLMQHKTVTASDFEGSKKDGSVDMIQSSSKSEDVKVDSVEETPAMVDVVPEVSPKEITSGDVPAEADMTQDSTQTHVDTTEDSTQSEEPVDTQEANSSTQSEEPVDTQEVTSSTQSEEPVDTQETNSSTQSEEPVDTQEANSSTQDTLTQTQDTLTQTQDTLTQTQDTLTQTQDTLTQTQETQETPTQSEFCVSVEDRPTVLYFDLPKKPTLTESEQMLCRMDTMSICMDLNGVEARQGEGHQSVEEMEIRVGTPPANEITVEDILATPSTNSIPSSPVTVDTPNRTTDLLNDTIDISPISSKSGLSDRDSVDSKEIPVAMAIEFKLLEELGTMDNVEVEKHDDDDDQYENVPAPENIPDVEVEDDAGHVEVVPETVDDAVIELGNVPDVVLNVQDEIEDVPDEDEKAVEDVLVEVGVAPDGNDEVMISDSDNNPEPVTRACTTIQERSTKLLNIVNFPSPASKRFLNRRRGAKISTMSPSTGRIKRLMSQCNQKPITELTEDVNTDEILTFTRDVPSPLAVPRTSILKRKLADSPDLEGVSPCAKRKRVNFSDPCLTSKKIFIKDDYQPSLEAKRLFDCLPDIRSKEDNLREIFEFVDAPLPSEKHTETDTLETEPPMEIINPMLLRKDRPIYPKLVDCKDEVLVVLKRVTSPMFVTTLMNKLKHKNVKTIGDLAKMSESEVNRFPFKVPVVANVFKALDNYYKKVGKEEVEAGQQVVKVNGFHEKEVVKRPVKVAKIDAKSELKQLMDRIKIEDVPLEDLKDLLSPLHKGNVVRLLTDHFQITAKDFLEGKDLQPAVLHVLGTLGVTKTIQMLFDSHNTSDERSSFIAAALDGLDAVPLCDILRRRSIEEFQNGLLDVVNGKVFSKQEVVDKCLLPLIENPSDIRSYVSRLSVVELSDVVLERLQGEKFDDFLLRIAQVRPTAALDRLCPAGDVVTFFKQCINAQSGDRQVEIMVEMFKFISGRLDAATLVQLHVDFLSKVPDMLRGK